MHLGAIFQLLFWSCVCLVQIGYECQEGRQPEKAITKDLSDAVASAHLFFFFILFFLLGSSVIHISEKGKGFVGFSLTEMSGGTSLSKGKIKREIVQDDSDRCLHSLDRRDAGVFLHRRMDVS